MSEHFLVRYPDKTKGKTRLRKFTDLFKAIDFCLEKCAIKSHPLVRQRYYWRRGKEAKMIVEYFDTIKFKIIRKEFARGENDEICFAEGKWDYFEWVADRYHNALCYDRTKGDSKPTELIAVDEYGSKTYGVKLTTLLDRSMSRAELHCC